MKNTVKNQIGLNIVAGQIVTLVNKPNPGSQIVEVGEVREDGKVLVFFGRQANGEFTRRAFYNADRTKKETRIVVGADDIAALVTPAPKSNKKGESKQMSEKDEPKTPAQDIADAINPDAADAGEGQPELKYELDADAPAGDEFTQTGAGQMKSSTGKKANKKTAGDKTGSKRDEAKGKVETTKKAVKKQTEAQKTADKIKKAVNKVTDSIKAAGLKVKETVETVAGEVVKDATTFKNFTLEQVEDAAAKVKALIKKTKEESQALAKTTLKPEEATERARIEAHVFKYLGTLKTAYFEIGASLAIANAKRLYRSTHGDFGSYVEEVFGLSRPQAHSIMNATKTFDAISGGAEKYDFKQLPSIRAAEAINQGSEKLLKSADLSDNADRTEIKKNLARHIFETVSDNAELDAKGQKVLAPALIEATVSVFEKGKLDVGGKEVVLNLGAKTADEMFVSDDKAAVKKAAEVLKANVQEAVKGLKAVTKPTTSKLTAALNSATGNGATIPEGQTPKLVVMCSIHGRNTLQDSTDTDITLGCGCVFINSTEGYVFEKNVNVTAPPATVDGEDLTGKDAGEGEAKDAANA
jgi:hypothetical protein